MKKLVLTLLVGALFSLPMSFGQGFQVGTNELSLGIGLGSSLGGVGTSGNMPAINFQYERGMWTAGDQGVISLGAFLGYKRYNYNFSGLGVSAKSTLNYTIIGARSAYHYTGLADKNWDLYGGLMLSYNIANSKYKDSSGNVSTDTAYGSTVGLTIYGGARYLFNDKFGVYGELGYGVSFLNLGVSLKL